MGAFADRRFPAQRCGFYAGLRDELKVHAEAWFKLNVIDKDGFTAREVIEGLLARVRNPDKRRDYEDLLVCPPLPPALEYLWRVYLRLRRRKGGGFGLSPVEWPDIDAFLRHSGMTLVPWEIEIIEDIDALFLHVNAPKKTTSEST